MARAGRSHAACVLIAAALVLAGGAGCGGADDAARAERAAADAGVDSASPRAGPDTAAARTGAPADSGSVDGPAARSGDRVGGATGSADSAAAGRRSDGEGGPVTAADLAEGGSPPPAARGERPRFRRPDAVRGIYLNAWAAGSVARSNAAIELARRTEINAVVIDLKDASGLVSYRTRVPLAREIQADTSARIRDLPGLLRRLEAGGVYPIARIVIVKDPILTAAHPELAVQDSAGGAWEDGKGVTWASLWDRRVWDYHVALAREAVEAGFPEIQWDYVRFPDGPMSERERIVYPRADGRDMTEAVAGFLEYARAELRAIDPEVQMTADVFGVTTSASRDVGIGQLWEDFIRHVDVALPMVYPSHYWEGSFGFETPNAFPYEIVRAALEDAVRRSDTIPGAGRVRPWLQDFTLGPPRYGAAEVRAQIQATYDAGIEEWILWNPGARYTEAALEPAGGYPDGWEPVIRIGGRLVPVSKRDEVLAPPADSTVAPAADSTGTPAAVPTGTSPADSTGAPVPTPPGAASGRTTDQSGPGGP